MQGSSAQVAKKYKSLTLGDTEKEEEEINQVKDELEKMNSLLKDLKQENEITRKDGTKTPRKSLLQLFANPPQVTPRDVNDSAEEEKKGEARPEAESVEGQPKTVSCVSSMESDERLEGRRLSNEFTQTIRKNSGTNLISLMKTQTGLDIPPENPVWHQLEEFIKNLETLTDERDDLVEQLNQVREGAIEALMEKEETILDLMTKLKHEVERKAEHSEKEAKQMEEEIHRLYEENCHVREDFLSEKEGLERRIQELIMDLDNQKSSFERNIFKLEQERVPSAVVIELREQLAELRNRENELLAEIRDRDRIIHKVEKERNDQLRESKENEAAQSIKIDNYEKKIIQLEKRLHSETWSNSSFEVSSVQSSQSATKHSGPSQKKEPENEKKRILEENLILHKQTENLERKLNEVLQKCSGLEKENEKLLAEKDNFMQNIEELEGMNEELALYLEKTKENFEKTIMEVQEKSRSEILCLKHELKEQERTHAALVENLNAKLASTSMQASPQNPHNTERTQLTNSSLSIELDTSSDLLGSYSLISPKHLESNRMFERNGVQERKREITTEEDLARMREYIKKSEERWSMENNLLRDDLKLAESIAVEAKFKLVKVAADKDFYMSKYNDLLNQMESGKPPAKKPKRSSIKNLFEDFKCKFAFSKKK